MKNFRPFRPTWFALVVCLVPLAGGQNRALASSYYRVTDLGQDARISLDANGQQVVVNPTTGRVTPFASTSFQAEPRGWWSLPETIAGNDPRVKDPDYFRGLPVQRYQVGSAFNPETRPSPMQVMAANSAGTVIGGYIRDHSEGSAPGYFAYTQKQDNGTFSPIQVFSLASGGDTRGSGIHFYLNKANQVLIDNTSILVKSEVLFDINTGTMTDLMDLLSPEDRSRFTWNQFYGLTDYRGLGLADDGSILMSATNSDRTKTVILLTPPTPTPEPSTLTLVALAGVGVAFRRLRRPRIPA